MKLWSYIGENVLIELTNGQQFIGKVTNYDDEVDNESGEDSIHLDDGKLLYDFDKSEIKYIKIIDKASTR
ncbi:LSM domain protein [Staphylococcus caprae]|uniref:LSM domain protein n=1 Tax=Staphylococcus caprae TaxID=29380 RepID=UPI003B20F470